VAIASTGRLYAWYDDGSRSVGSLDDLDLHTFDDVSDGADKFGLASGQGYTKIVGIAIAKSNDRTFAWYQDGTKSSGTTWDLDQHSHGDPYTTAGGQTSYDIRSMAIALDDTIYAFYGDNTVSSGTSWELDRYQGTYATTWAAGVTAQPWWNWYGDMTPRHLLSHTAGFYGGGDVGGTETLYGIPEGSLQYELTHRYMLRTRKLLFAPATDAKYSNHGLGLSGFLLSEVAGSYSQHPEHQISHHPAVYPPTPFHVRSTTHANPHVAAHC